MKKLLFGFLLVSSCAFCRPWQEEVYERQDENEELEKSLEAKLDSLHWRVFIGKDPLQCVRQGDVFKEDLGEMRASFSFFANRLENCIGCFDSMGGARSSYVWPRMVYADSCIKAFYAELIEKFLFVNDWLEVGEKSRFDFVNIPYREKWDHLFDVSSSRIEGLNEDILADLMYWEGLSEEYDDLITDRDRGEEKKFKHELAVLQKAFLEFRHYASKTIMDFGSMKGGDSSFSLYAHVFHKITDWYVDFMYDWIFHKIKEFGNISRAKYVPFKFNKAFNLSDSQVNLSVLNELLCGAVREGDFSSVKFLVEGGADVHCQGELPLFVAFEKGHMEIARYLIENGADVKRSDLFQRTPLHYAVFTHSMEAIREMVRLGVDVNAVDLFGFTPLLCVLEDLWFMENEKSVIKTLVDLGADVKDADKEGRTPLHLFYPFDPEDIEVVELFIGKGADVNVKDIQGKTPLFEAFSRGLKDVVLALLKAGAKVELQGYAGEPLLHKAVYNNWEDLVVFLMEKGAEVNEKDKDGMTPLHMACDRLSKYEDESLPLVKFLVDKGAEINVQDHFGRTPFFQSLNCKKIATYLLEKGADVSVLDDSGKSVLHQISFWSCDLDFAKTVIEKGAQINARDEKGETPLYSAVAYDDFEFAQYLIEIGADVNLSDLQGDTPLHRGIYHVDLLALLVGAKADINALNNNGKTPLLVALDKEYYDAACFFMEEGANVNISDSRGYSPLHKATLCNLSEMVASLIEKGSKINARDYRGRTSLLLATTYGRKDIAKDLIHAGADVFIADHEGNTPLHSAANNGYKDLVSLIEIKGGKKE